MTSRGHNDHAATIENHSTKTLFSVQSNDTGAKAIKILFSWTWKLAKKKASAEFAQPHKRHVKSWHRPAVVAFWACPTLNSLQQLGIIKKKVIKSDARGYKSSGMRSRMLIGLTDKAHQILETLPSNNPLSKGKIRRRTCTSRSIDVVFSGP